MHRSLTRIREKKEQKDAIVDVSISVAVLILLAGIIAFINNYKFGSVFETGYGQWQKEFGFSLADIIPHFIKSLISPQNSLFINFPHLIISIVVFKYFYNRYKQEAFLMFFTILPIYTLIYSFGNWTGDWTYGPRYFLFALPVMALPSLCYRDFFSSHKKFINYFLSITFCLFLSVSTFLSINTNSLSYFITYRIKYNLSGMNDNPFIKQYFEKEHLGLIAYDLNVFKYFGKEPVFLKALSPFIAPATKESIKRKILGNLEINNYWIQND